jgi:hypothetical protein
MSRRVHREHGTRGRYQSGCGCDDCTLSGEIAPCRCDGCLEASRIYHAGRTNRHHPSPPPLSTVVQLVPPTPASDDQPSGPPGEAEETVEAAVRRELASLPSAASMPGQAAAALRLARLLDQAARTAPQQPAAAAQLRLTLEAIRSRVDTSAKSPLAVLRGGRAGSA